MNICINIAKESHGIAIITVPHRNVCAVHSLCWRYFLFYLKTFIILAAVFIAAYAVVLSPLVRRLFRPVTSLTAKHSRFPFWLGLAAVVLVTGIYSIIVYNHSFPMAEGWYTLFSKYILSGKKPYEDFELLFTPGYSYLIAGIIKLFGYNIIVLRVAGAVLFSLIACVLYLIFSKAFTPWISVVAACIASFFMQSEVAQVFYDYIRVYDLFNLLTCLFLVLWVRAELADSGTGNSKPALYACLTGVLAGFAILIRQNSGCVVLAYGIILMFFILLVTGASKKKIRRILIFLGSALAPILILALVMKASNLLDTYLSMTTTDAIASKGGMTAVLFGWIPRTIPEIIKLWKEILGIVLLLAANIFLYVKKGRKNFISDPSDNVKLVFFTGASAAVIVVMFLKKRISVLFTTYFYDWLTPYSLFAVGLLIFIAVGVYCLIKRKRIPADRTPFVLSVLTISGFYIATAYGSATSAGFSEGQSAIIIGLLFALFLYYSRHIFSREASCLVMAFAICFSMACVGKKYDLPYSWWGLSETDIREADYTVDVPLMDGILVTKERKAVLEGIYNDIIANSTEEDSIFVFPHIPIFYVMSDRYPETFTLVQWFDVSSEKRVLEDIQTLEANPPKVLVLCRIPEGTISGHEKLFRGGQFSAQRKMMNSLFYMAYKDGYDKINEYDLGGGYVVSVYSLPS